MHQISMILLIKHPQAAQKQQWQQQHRQLHSGWGVHPSCPHYLSCAWHQPRCSHQPITLKWGFGDTATYQQVPGATGADLYGFPTAHKCGRQPASPQTCKVRGRRKSRGCLTSLHLGCAHSCTYADSAATGDKDLRDIVPCWGREPRNWGGPHELRKWGAASQGSWKRAVDGAKTDGPRDFFWVLSSARGSLLRETSSPARKPRIMAAGWVVLPAAHRGHPLSRLSGWLGNNPQQM